MKTKMLKTEMKQRARGRYKVMVLDRENNILHERPWQKNLILDGGLDRLGSGIFSTNEFLIYPFTWSGVCLFASVGTGNTPTSDDSGATTASQSGTTVTLSGTLAAVSAGKLIRWDTGEEALVVSGSDTTWTVDRTQTVSSGEFTVYRVDQTNLATWVKNSNAYLTGSGNSESTTVSNTRTYRRTYEFSAEVGSVNYTECGVSWDNGSDPDLFSRILFSGGAVTVLADQKIRIIYELDVTVGPITPTATTSTITGWPVSPASTQDGDEMVQQIGLSTINSSDAAVEDSSNGGNEPSGVHGPKDPVFFLSPVSTAHASFGSTVNRTSGAVTKEMSLSGSYSVGSFFRDRTITLSAAEGNGTTFRSMGWGHVPSSSNQSSNAASEGFTVVFDEAQTKDDEHQLTVNFRISWDRDLS